MPQPVNGRREEPGGSRSQRAGLSSERSFGKRPGRQAVGEMVAHRCAEGAALMHFCPQPRARGSVGLQSGAMAATAGRPSHGESAGSATTGEI